MHDFKKKLMNLKKMRIWKKFTNSKQNQEFGKKAREFRKINKHKERVKAKERERKTRRKKTIQRRLKVLKPSQNW